jgi:hypothetical protein
MIRTYRTLPPVVNGYPLDDVWSVVIPIARTNLVINPSFETNTTSWTAIGGSIARSTTQQYHGAYSLAITPTAATTDGARFDTVSLTSGTTYAYSAKVRGVANLKYKIAIETTGGVELASVTFTATGRWQWISGYYTETSSTTRRFTVRKAAHTSVAIFYLDGVQVEAIASGETVSTYIDGDQLGLVPNQQPVAYYWNGTPHASSSARSGQTRAGGMVVPFKKYGFLITAIIGLGLAGVHNVATDYARIDGSYDDYTRKPSRQFTLTGRFQGRTYAELRRNRSGLAQYFDRDLVGQDQRLTLLRHVEKDGQIVTSDVRLLAKYQGGLEGNTDNMHAETVPITFTLYMPNILADGEDGESLSVQTSIGSGAQGILQRSAAGVWSAMGTGGTSGGASTIVQGLDGKIYAGGDFTQMGGVANTNAIAVWDPVAGSWAAMGTGAAGGTVVYSLSVLPNGNVVAVGNFTSMGGVANTSRIALWNGSAWSSISSAFVGTEIVASAVSPAGILYVGGTFSSVGGAAATNVTSYNPTTTTWAAVGAGIAAGGVFDLLCSGTSIYAAVEASGVYKSTGGNFSSIGATTTEPNALAMDSAGNLYAAGNFTIIGGVSANNIAKYNGVSWSPLGSGLTSGVVARNALFFDAQGQLTVGGTFTTAGGIVVPGRSARWNGGAWTFIDVIPDAASPTIRNGLLASSGVFYLGLNNTAGTATAAATTTITNTGTAKSYPTLIIKGPSSGTARIYSVINATTGRSIYLNLTINAGETVKMVFQPDNLSFTSDFQGNIAGAILGGSNEADFFFQPGANSIAFLSASSTVTATLSWRPAFASMDDVP